MIDLAAERARSLARQEERYAPERMRARARRVLELNWNATEAEMREKIAYEWPNLNAADTDELLAATLEVQRTERRTITPDPEPTMPRATPPAEKQRITDFVRSQLKSDRSLVAREVISQLHRLHNIKIAEPTFYKLYWGPVRAELEIRGTPKRNGAKTEPPTNGASGSATSIVVENQATEVAGQADDDAELSGIVHGDKAQALSEESRSLRATYEAGDYVRLEDQDGEWRLMVSLSFGSRADASAALAGLAGAV
jgi:hypothetical protein